MSPLHASANASCDVWCVRRSWPMMDDVRGKVLFVLVDSSGKYGPMYRTLFPGLRNATFFVSQPGAAAILPYAPIWKSCRCITISCQDRTHVLPDGFESVLLNGNHFGCIRKIASFRECKTLLNGGARSVRGRDNRNGRRPRRSVMMESDPGCSSDFKTLSSDSS